MGVLSALLRPSEFVALLKLKKKIGEWKKRSAAQEKDADWEFCFDMLNKVSRSFAIVIEQLGDELRNAICVFYLVLRGLDTVGRITSSRTLMVVGDPLYMGGNVMSHALVTCAHECLPNMYIDSLSVFLNPDVWFYLCVPA
jgi:hypothetical protein